MFGPDMGKISVNLELERKFWRVYVQLKDVNFFYTRKSILTWRCKRKPACFRQNIFPFILESYLDTISQDTVIYADH